MVDGGLKVQWCGQSAVGSGQWVVGEEGGLVNVDGGKKMEVGKLKLRKLEHES